MRSPIVYLQNKLLTLDISPFSEPYEQERTFYAYIVMRFLRFIEQEIT
jgi:hypothetical protein